MVAVNPLFSGPGLWSSKKLQATVINDIWPDVLFFTLIATMVCCVSTFTSHSLSISNQLLSVLGTVLGLVISFRTTSAYERYQDGRKSWTTLHLASRNLGHMIWNHIPFERLEDGEKPPDGGAAPKPKTSVLAGVIEKKTMVNLVQAFSVATKHMLRGEPGVYYEDLYPLICFLPRYSIHPPLTHGDDDRNGHSTSENRRKSWINSLNSRNKSKNTDDFDPEKVLPTVQCERPLRPARNPPEASAYDYLPILRIFKPLISLVVRGKMSSMSEGGKRTLSGKKKYVAVESNVPLEISLFLSSYFAWLLKNGFLTPVAATAINNGLTSLQETVMNLERIRNTPLPFAYQAHLRMTLWLYLFFLPFELFSSFKWLTIPATAFASFLFLGFLEIGQEIENPFNYDLNDLDLDGFCLSIQRELAEITAHTSPVPQTFIFSEWNQPFAPADRRSAQQIMLDVDHAYHGAETGMHSIRRTLLKSWRDVDRETRHHYWHATQN
ncbi:UPF0187-domain-containing protein [Stereum hirsutum FP-91666 SS1]|uniref:UPF0187-domain-containing protein n=1 Tax=Stereum hirsutum (strain FP-91666) TaxID=721885 RepID=UPI000440AF61|nr:UPF0187-domain-containing protein [Stereum hirsutum FP-91666 SS1]EIM88499.1 UPF0187-domain-containing protein [Stereum hirsutum FP-91666 SS1]